MNKALLFTKRNIKEMLRDPLIYIFCAGFPIAMVLLFQIILTKYFFIDNIIMKKNYERI